MSRSKNISQTSFPGRLSRISKLASDRIKTPPYSGSLSTLLHTRASIAFRIDKYGFKVPKYQNTYQLESPNPYSITEIDRILQSVMNSSLSEDIKYNPEECMKLCKDISAEIRRQIWKKYYPRYKYIVDVTIIEKKNQGIHVGCGHLFDTERDNYFKFSVEKPEFYAYGFVAIVYYE